MGMIDYAVIRTDKEPYGYKSGDELVFKDGRIVTHGEGSRHVASGRAAVLNRIIESGNYEVRYYEK